MKRSDMPVLDLLREVEAYRAESEASIAAAGGIAACMLDISLLTPTPDLPSRLADRYPPKVTMARIMQLVSCGLLEYGVVASRPWLTDAGKTLLREERSQAAK